MPLFVPPFWVAPDAFNLNDSTRHGISHVRRPEPQQCDSKRGGWSESQPPSQTLGSKHRVRRVP